MYKRIISTILAIVIVTLTGTTVMAKDVNANVCIPANMQLVASYTEQLDGDVTVVKKLYLDQSQFARGFSGIRQGTVVHDIYSNNGAALSMRVVGNASFSSPSSNYVTVMSASYDTIRYDDWLFNSSSDNRESGSQYAKYTVNYSAHNNLISGAAWIKCDVSGFTDNNSKSIQPNSVQIGDSVVSFG